MSSAARPATTASCGLTVTTRTTEGDRYTPRKATSSGSRPSRAPRFDPAAVQVVKDDAAASRHEVEALGLAYTMSPRSFGAGRER